MRQWLVYPCLMCDRHLLGEHVEHHMIAGAIRRGKSLDGYLRRGQILPGTLPMRHALLAQEMERRGMRHRSPLGVEDFGGRLNDYISRGGMLLPRNGLRAAHRADLTARCETCRALHEGRADVRP